MVKSMAGHQTAWIHICLVTYKLCDFGKIIEVFCASVSLGLKED